MVNRNFSQSSAFRAATCIGTVMRALLVGLVLLAIGGCATNGTKDPLEPVNRKVHAFNRTADRWVLKPVAEGYVSATPQSLQNGVSNIFDNLLYPTVIINQLLQGKAKTGVQDAGRFLINSTVGLLGLFDVATQIGLEKNEEDFGQTFAVWGFPRGAYLVLPLLGPSSIREGSGSLAGIVTYPVTYIEPDVVRWSLFGLRTIDARANLLGAEPLITGDEYTFTRDAYLQRRDFLIRDGKPQQTDPFLDQ